ncbi:ATP-dependent endonuclease [Deinococcus sp. JMULE3]|uniref:ATP-dependent nuclease n=1 Tax=Deinococcus sp. JMULE3 TaxID=2518341 RepID=UPI0015761A18|nr:AAA family ATPase [Deinococcus sp. JMULE3]NTY01573.1 hypothetical protein [Deinococcus sp. JMULE3]
MNLAEVRIKNFRSIKTATVKFDSSPKVLLGVNESGKTNILKAIRLLDKDISPVADDIRQPSHDESHDAEAFVIFIFEPDAEEIKTIREECDSRILAFNYFNEPIISDGNKNITAGSFLETKHQVLYHVALNNLTKHYSFWTPQDRLKPAGDWYTPPKDLPSGEVMVNFDQKVYDVKNFPIIHGELLDDVQKSKLNKALVQDWYRIVFQEGKSILSSNHPVCIYWDYSEKNLLHERIDKDAFLANPEISNPLKHIFWLSGIRNIKEEFDIQSKKAAGIRNLLIRVAANATRYIHEAWPEYKSISISLTQNGQNIESYIQDKYNQYGMSSRSDGFKRFITFILSVSVRNASNDLKNVIFIQDEPDTSLHPSAARHLLSELIKISDTNKVIFSTHSIFMIDKNKIENHYIVRKNDETTEVIVANSSNVADEEVLYNSLGYSLFDILKETNLIFEGWKDKKFFGIAISAPPYKLRRVKKLQNYGMTHAFGVKDVPRVASFLEMVGRNYYVISDSDQPAKEKQSKFEGDGVWLRYDQLLNIDKEIMLEDFYVTEYIEEIIERHVSNVTFSQITDRPVLSIEFPVLEIIEKWLSSNGLSRSEIKEFSTKIKEDLISGLTVEK